MNSYWILFQSLSFNYLAYISLNFSFLILLIITIIIIFSYLTMADDAMGRRIPFAFLEDIRTRFKSTYGKLNTIKIIEI